MAKSRKISTCFLIILDRCSKTMIYSVPNGSMKSRALKKMRFLFFKGILHALDSLMLATRTIEHCIWMKHKTRAEHGLKSVMLLIKSAIDYVLPISIEELRCPEWLPGVLLLNTSTPNRLGTQLYKNGFLMSALHLNNKKITNGRIRYVFNIYLQKVTFTAFHFQ